MDLLIHRNQILAVPGVESVGPRCESPWLKTSRCRLAGCLKHSIYNRALFPRGCNLDGSASLDCTLSLSFLYLPCWALFLSKLQGSLMDTFWIIDIYYDCCVHDLDSNQDPSFWWSGEWGMRRSANLWQSMSNSVSSLRGSWCLGYLRAADRARIQSRILVDCRSSGGPLLGMKQQELLWFLLGL